MSWRPSDLSLANSVPPQLEMEKHELYCWERPPEVADPFVLTLSSRTRLKVISDEGSYERLRNLAKMHAIPSQADPEISTEKMWELAKKVAQLSRTSSK
jgi:hypothetical protein